MTVKDDWQEGDEFTHADANAVAAAVNASTRVEIVSAPPESGVPGVLYVDVVSGKFYKWEE